jgi:hypothetical protein
MCNGWGNVNADRDECVKRNPSPTVNYPDFRYGATHVRYDCTSKSLWVLTYVFAVGAAQSEQQSATGTALLWNSTQSAAMRLHRP